MKFLTLKNSAKKPSTLHPCLPFDNTKKTKSKSQANTLFDYGALSCPTRALLVDKVVSVFVHLKTVSRQSEG